MPDRKLIVKVNRTFNRYLRGSELMVDETDEVKAEVKAGLLTVIDTIEKPKAKITSPPAGAKKPAAKKAMAASNAAKPKAKKKSKKVG